MLRRLWKLYEEQVLPTEKRSFYAHFCAPPITPEEFESRPQVLLVGQYSTGKTSMVRWLTGADSTHFDIRPQPSTDKFMAVVHGAEEQMIQGNAAAVLPQLPYQGLACFGTSFLSSFQALVHTADILREITFIDTPGVLAGRKQSIGRDYDFAKICAWMADRADLVLLTFDAHKLDISDEFQEVMEVLRPYTDRVRCVLNKADQIDAANLVRVYGALLWNVGKILQTPEVTRVFISSFWSEPYRFKDHQQLFDEDKKAVLEELHSLPRTSLLRKINTFVTRVRKLKAHVCIVSQLRAEFPFFAMNFGSDERLRNWASDRLDDVFEDARRRRGLSQGDLPNIEHFRARLGKFENMLRLPVWSAKEIQRLDHVLEVEIPALMASVGGVTRVSARCRAPSPDEAGERRGFCGSRKRKRDE